MVGLLAVVIVVLVVIVAVGSPFRFGRSYSNCWLAFCFFFIAFSSLYAFVAVAVFATVTVATDFGSSCSEA